MGRLDGKVALITGSARGMGAETARVFVEEGAKVLVSDILDEQGEAVAKDLGKNAIYVRLDVREESDWTRAITLAKEHFGKLNVLVNNAAILHVASLEDHTVEDFKRVMMVNEIGVFLGIRSVIAPMTEAGGGVIVNISSMDGVIGAPGSLSYVASKFAMGGLTRTAAAELASLGIRVNGMLPSAGNPELWLSFLPGATGPEAYLDHVPLPPVGRRGTLLDCALAIVYLASDESGFVNGTDLLLDGGYMAGPSSIVTV